VRWEVCRTLLFLTLSSPRWCAQDSTAEKLRAIGGTGIICEQLIESRQAGDLSSWSSCPPGSVPRVPKVSRRTERVGAERREICKQGRGAFRFARRSQPEQTLQIDRLTESRSGVSTVVGDDGRGLQSYVCAAEMEKSRIGLRFTRPEFLTTTGSERERGLQIQCARGCVWSDVSGVARSAGPSNAQPALFARDRRDGTGPKDW
jgi:hypothetical protein